MFVIICTYYFNKLGNTLSRPDESGNLIFSIFNLFTEGFIGPIRSFILLLLHGESFSCFRYIWFELFRLSNPFSVMIFLYYIYNIIKRNN